MELKEIGEDMFGSDFEEMAMDAMIDIGLPEDEAERMLEDFNY